MTNKFLLLLICILCTLSSLAQYNDGPIEIQVKLKEVNTIFDATDIGQNSTIASLATPDELSYILWARDNLGGVWTGGTCFTSDFTPAYNSGNGTPSSDFNSVFATLLYPTSVNPQFVDIKLDAWEDDNNSDAFTTLSFVGITANTSGLRTDWDDYACQVSIWLPFIGTTCLYSDGDDYRCLAEPFKSGLDYRLGTPCEWYNHGFIQGDIGACVNTSSDPSAPNTNGYYEPHIETFWRYTKGTSFANAINLGVLPTSPTSLQHSNSNECYINNYSASTGNDVIYSFDIINPTGVNISLCGGSTGAQFDSYLYLVNGNDTTTAIEMNDNSCSGLQSQILTSLCTPGIYYVVVDATDATEFGTFTLNITEDPANTFSVIDSISDYNGEDISCNAGSDGKFYAHVNGGSPPYTFAWSNGLNHTTNNYNDSITGLVAGNYSVTVTDFKGCTLPPLSVTLVDPSVISVTTTATATSCNSYSDGVITVTNTSGGISTLPYSYSWNTTPIQAGISATSLSAGSYILTVTDANGCSITHQQAVTEPSAPSMSITSSNASVNNNPLTYEVCDGNDITLTANGSSLVSYSWAPNIWLIPNTNTLPTVTSSPNSPGMTYTCTGTDAVGCTTDVVVQVNVVSSVSMYASDPSPQVCEGEDIEVIWYGDPGTNFDWNPPIYLSSPSSISGQPITINPLDTITYTITAQNASGCTDETKLFVDILPAPNIINATPLAPNSVCYGSSVPITASGANSYSWYPYSTLNNNFGNVVTASPIIPTTYWVVGTDLNGCKDSVDITISVNPLPILSVTGTNSICEGESTSLLVNSASVITSYIWTPSTSLDTAAGNIVSANPLTSQTYSIVGIDLNQCEGDTSYTVAVLPAPNVFITASPDTICRGSSSILQGNNGALSYNWVPFSSLNTNTGFSVTASPTTTTTYSVLGTSSVNNCSATDTVTIYVNPLPILDAIPNVSTICAGDSIEITANGAQNFIWSPALGLNTTLGSLVTANPITNSYYTITGTDINGCTDVISATVNVNPKPTIILSSIPNTNDICEGASLDINAFGAVLYSWSPSVGLNTTFGSSVSASPSTSTYYTVIGTDINSCTNSANFQLNVGINPTVSITPENPIICEGESIALSADGANTYIWMPSSTLTSSVGVMVNANPLSSITYTLLGTDSLGCEGLDSTTVSVNPLPTADLSINNDIIICKNDSAMILVEPTGNPPWHITFAVNGSIQNIINTNSSPIIYVSEIEGTYTVPFIEDANNCSNIGSDSVNVEVLNTPIASFDLSPQPADVLDSEITFSNNSIFADTWFWDFGDGFFDFTNFNTFHDYYDAGTYQVTLVVNNSICSDTAQKKLTIDPVFTIYIPETFTPNNDGLNDVFLPKGKAIAEFEMFIFNRWGEQIFYSDHINYGWNGLVENDGKVVATKYAYTINITDELGVFHTFSGGIILNTPPK